MQRRITALFLICIIMAGTLAACKPVQEASAPPSDEEVVITVAGSWPDCRALDIVAGAFTEKYPNCTVSYEYLQDYYPSLIKRMGGDNPVDLFFTTNIQEGSELQPYALDLNSCDQLDLSHTFQGLIDNFTFREADSEGKGKLYAIPLGAEIRGMYVNKTLLGTLGLEVPTDQASLLAACQVLKDNGYIPFHGNPGEFSQHLLYPWVCNLIANADDPQAAFAKVNAHEPGVSEMFREPYEFLYTLVENDYYDYKTAQNDTGLFVESSDDYYARYFLNILDQADGTPAKVDDIGQIAFMPSAMSLQGTIDKTKEDYHSGIEYTFILAPTGTDGGFAYMSPAHGIGANKASANMEWTVKFLDFLFQPENNKLFTEAFHVIPNTEEALAYTEKLYSVPDDHISELGQVTFAYGFYDIIRLNMVDVSKANNPKYMQDDGSGNMSLYPLDFYMENLENSLQEQ
ncbi:MAG: ABC transporter substrate-binding protein [bacterium]|nr:ABC transporter substrate-binding protein [bacterium]